MNEILVKCQYLCTYIRVTGPRSLIAPVDGRMDGWNGRKAGRRSSCHSVQEIIPTEYKCKAGNTRAAAPPVQSAVFQTLTGRSRHSAASWLPGRSYSYGEGHLSEDELGSGCLAPTHPSLPHPLKPGGLLREERRL